MQVIPQTNNQHHAVIKRASLSAILSGVVIALSCEMVFNLLGLSLGFNAFQVDTDILLNLGIGTILWFTLVSALSLFIGGWVAGRLINESSFASVKAVKIEGALHGLVSWGLVTLFTFILMATTVGALIGGIANIVGQSMSFVGQSVSELGKSSYQLPPEIADTIKEAMPTINPAMNQIKEEVDQFLATLQKDKDFKDKVLSEQSKKQFEKTLKALLSASTESDFEKVRQNLVLLLVQLGMSQPQAEQKVSDWEQQFKVINSQIHQQTAAIKQKAVTKAEQASNVLAKGAIILFAMFLLNAIMGLLGGMLGALQGYKNV